MKNVSFAFPLALLVSTGAFAEAPAQTQTKSPAFSKGECSVAYVKAGEKVSSYTIIKKDSLAKLNQIQPKDIASETCSKEIKAELKIESGSCQVFCNPN
jgi:hypothetical protein